MADIDTPPIREGITFGPFSLFPGERLLTLDDAPVEIGGRSLDLLIVLTEQPGRVLSKRDLLKRVWSDVVVEDGSLRFHMAGLRKLLGDGKDGARYIATQVGVGYAFVAKVERHGPAVSPVAAPAAPLEPVTAPLNLPQRLPLLIGRERDIDLLQQRVARTPLFTIVGPGGVGKTSLAVEMGHLLADSFQQQVAFIDFSMLENPELVPGMLAGGMGLAVQGADPLAAILGHLRDRPFLLLLDNCEHLIEQVALLVERLIEAAPQLRILATSREPLRVRGEHIHRLDALTCPEDEPTLTTEAILASPAVQLLRDRACAADSSLRIDDEAARLMAMICHRLDGMALALELAAGRIATHGLHAAARQLEERFSLGWAGRRTALPRQQTLQAMLDWSYDLLTEAERIVLERLCVFVGPFSVDAALEVVADAALGSDSVVAALDELVAKSLIAPDRARGASNRGAGSYRLLEMTRAYARQKLQARGDEAFNATARRHAAYFLAELEAIAAQDEDVLQDPRPLRQQLGNIRSALDWSFGPEGNRRIGVRLAAASTVIFLNLSHYAECQGWCARALDEIEETQRGTALEMELQGALGLALMFSRGSTRAAGQALSRALEVATALDDPWGQLRMLGRLHIYHERIGDCAITMEHARRAVAIADTMEEAEAIGVARSLSGISHYLAGDQRQARKDLQLSLAVCPVLSRNRMLYYGFDHRNRSTIGLARSLWLSGHAERAIAMSQQAVDLAIRLDQPVTLCIALIWQFALHLWRDDLDAAEEALASFAECAQTNALGPYIIAAEGFHADLAIRHGKGGPAIEAVEQSLAQLRATRYELLTTNFSMVQARGLLLDKRWREAATLIDDTMARCTSIGEGFAMPELLGLKARIAEASGQEPIPILEQALALSQEQGAEAWVLRTGIALASRHASQGRPKEAARQLEAVLASLTGEPDKVELGRAHDLVASFNATNTPG
ncbi:ATP-binding protein [Novosphingobium terrae]|uniref:ATP-binding protein n=1 Tax=Novosphingobium terrae TaxID=2726189 RepID=UPI00197FEEB4|nr:winged helix-turn-helix domain-containing protein [Novosphingobium terrae]